MKNKRMAQQKNENSFIIINLNAIDYKVQKSFKGLLYFEEMTGTNVAEMQESATNMLKLFYCLIKAANKSFTYTFDEFINYIDENPGIIEKFNNYLAKGLNPKFPPKK